MSQPNRSPIKDKPLRLPGQSLRDERQALLNDKIEPWLLLALFELVLAAWEWLRYLFKLPPSPWLVTAAVAATLVFAAWRVVRLRPRLKQLRQGIEGEVAVGQFLEGLRSSGFAVFHDVMADGFNIDHVLIGTMGCFTVETKTWSKPAKGDARIQFDGVRLLANGHEPDRNVVAQVSGQSRWLARQLQDSTGRRFTVQPVLLFPGWFVEPPVRQASVWVLEPKALPAFLAHEPARLSADDAKLAAYHLSRYVRAREREA